MFADINVTFEEFSRECPEFPFWVVTVWHGNVLVSINEVTLRRAWLVLGRVTGPGFMPQTYPSIAYNQPCRSAQPGNPCVGIGAIIIIPAKGR